MRLGTSRALSRCMGTRTGMLLAMSIGLLAGCSAESSPADEVAEEDVVGVTDLTALESALGLAKDVKTKGGAYSRKDAILKSGPCYLLTRGPNATDAKSWEFRRYTNGAAFFRKLGTAPATGDQRPVACVDLDSAEGNTLALEGFALDAALRYGLGRLEGSDGGAGHAYLTFAKGEIEVRDAEHHCGFYDLSTSEPSNDPAWKAGSAEFADCRSQKGTEDQCNTYAYEACKAAFAADAAPLSVDRPKYQGNLVLGFGFADLQPQVAMVAYRFALKKAAESDAFSLTNDPIGRYVSHEGVSELHSITHYDHADVDHSMENPGVEAIRILTKGAPGAKPAVLAECKRSIADTGVPTGAFTCTGL